VSSGRPDQDRSAAYSVIEASFDVSDAVPVEERCEVAATLFVPDALPDRPTVFVALPGAALSRRYFDITLGERTEFSQARHFAERGSVFVAMDYLGGGDSSRPSEGEELTIPVLAAASHRAVEGLRRGLADGSLLGRQLSSFRLFANGFSFGSAICMVQQATYEDFEAILNFGYSPLASADGVKPLPGDWDQLSVAEKRASVLKRNEEFVGGALPVYHPIPRSGFWSGFYVDGTPAELLRYDVEVLETTVPRSAGLDAMTDGFTRPYTSKITVPIFLAFGDRDTVVDTHIQPTAYPACTDLLLTTYPNMGHLHNFCESRISLWNRSIAWAKERP
jgi:dienelactone hydrolase